jgi:hypothetical protein
MSPQPRGALRWAGPSMSMERKIPRHNGGPSPSTTTAATTFNASILSLSRNLLLTTLQLFLISSYSD